MCYGLKVSQVRMVLLASACVFAVAHTAAQAAATAPADEYQEHIDKSFPGFQILDRSEFWKFIRDMNMKEHPGLITGTFNDDDLEDFAAIIRRKTKKQRGSYEYYDGKIVICNGTPKGGFQCQAVQEWGFIKSSYYLKKRSAGPVGCWETTVEATTDIVADITDVAAGAFFYQPDGTYKRCTTAD